MGQVILDDFSQEMAEYFKEHIFDNLDKIMKGPMLYHYTSMEALNNILDREKCFWITRVDFMNDYKEVAYVTEVVQAIIGEIEKSKEKDTFIHLYKDFASTESYYKDLNIFAFSLTENPDSLPLWYNYGANEGCNIGIDASKFFGQSFNSQITFVGKVVYDEEKQRQIVKEVITRLLQLVRAENLSEESFSRAILFTFGTLGCFIKHPAFVSEEEFRFIFIPKSDEHIHFRVSRGAFIPFIKVPVVEHNAETGEDKLLVRKITIGPRTKLDIVKSGLEFYLSVKKLEGIELCTSRTPLRF
ncbi:DUF2971 domain-containing protein [Neobacillus rhizophilus]|uniref:DUF2971 domain-containing protein n=1 Tax=Neobacillus rhizophilus TaxID=2833579 RepID=A0A942YVF0_9BACI|nr:DUF2971 domain-containing protein [Neobacillus rhizophilus]MBS4213867.1 DUF2971 domain-containing protein [Neobacillus rhizophilus]MBU8917729.1 DUF2971 domain-containing protein [Bacillus sp. FJAT-29953]